MKSDQQNALKELFQLYDKDKSGKLDIAEAKTLIKDFCHKFDKKLGCEDLQKMFKLLDENHDSSVDIHELEHFLHSQSE